VKAFCQQICRNLYRHITGSVLRQKADTRLVCSGLDRTLRAAVCVMTSVLGALALGYRTILIIDAVFVSADQTHHAAVRLFHSRFGQKLTEGVSRGVQRQPAFPFSVQTVSTKGVVEMTQHVPPIMREPKGDHNRRLSLGMEPEKFAAAAGITVEQLRAYELTGPDQEYDLAVADRIGWALERLEADPPASQKVIN
jgi:hypothetical protein